MKESNLEFLSGNSGHFSASKRVPQLRSRRLHASGVSGAVLGQVQLNDSWRPAPVSRALLVDVQIMGKRAPPLFTAAPFTRSGSLRVRLNLD